MSRKKKKGKKQRAAREGAAPASPTAESAPTVAEPAPRAPVAEAREPEAEVPPTPPAQVTPPARPAVEAAPSGSTVADLDADLDDDGSSDYQSLVALVANLPDETTPTSRAPAKASRRDTELDEELEVVDLDDDGGGEAVDRLIAKAVVGAPPDEVEEEPEVPVIDLDADEPPAPRSGRTAGPIAAANQEAARLALAAARGAVDEDDVPPISLDLGEVSTPEARARLLAQALAHAEHQEARYRVPTDTGATRRWKGVLATLVFVLAGWVAVAPPGWVVPEPPAQMTAAARARAIRSALLLQAQQVEAFRVEVQRLPASLEELPSRLPGIGYARAGNRAYQLIAYEPSGNAIVFDSSDPSPPFQALMSAWPPAEEGP